MATQARAMPRYRDGDEGFFVGGAIAMTLVIVAGFSTQLAMGRSSFGAPPLVHAHAIFFMGWVLLYLAQNLLVLRGNIALHRQLGRLAAVLVLPMICLAFAVTLALVWAGRVPFFFTPLQFLIFDPLTVIAFAGLTAAAIHLRHESDWHRRLHFCAMTLLVGPGVGRLLPVGLLIPWVFETHFAVTMIFPLAGMIADLRRNGRVHPAWFWGLGVFALTVIAVEALTYCSIGTALYGAVTAGTPGASVAPLSFPPH